MNAKVPGAPFRATRPLATVVWFAPPLPPSCRAQPTKQSEHPGTNLGLTVHAEKTVLFCFFFYFPAPARRARDQHCFVRDNELFPASVRLARADTTGLATDGKPPRPHGNPREGSSPPGAAQAPPEVRGAKKHASAQAEGGALGWTSTRRNTDACGRTTRHGVPHGRVRAMLTRSPGAQSAEHEALPTREPSGSGPRAHSGPAPRSAVLPWAPRPHPAPIRPHRIYRPVPSRTHKAEHPSAPTPGRQWGWESPRSGREGLGGLSCVPRA